MRPEFIRIVENFIVNLVIKSKEKSNNCTCRNKQKKKKKRQQGNGDARIISKFDKYTT